LRREGPRGSFEKVVFPPRNSRRAVLHPRRIYYREISSNSISPRDEGVEKYHAIEGGQQTLSKLAAYVTEIVRKGVED
jgi:hypothetical protein